MKARVTNKMLRENQAIKVGYCAMTYLLRYEEPVYYTSGVYGWNSDVYNIDGIIVSTGYRPAGTRRIDYKTIEVYEGMARDIADDDSLSYYHKKCRVRALLNELLSKAVEK